MRTVLLILLFSLSFAVLHAQDSLPVYRLTADTLPNLTLPDSFTRIWKDQKESAGFNDMQTGQFQHAFHVPSPEKNQLLYPGVYWLHYKIENAAGKPLHLALTSSAYFSTIYSKQGNDAWEKKETGWYRSWHRKDGAKKGNSIPYTLQPGEKLDVYQRDHFWQQIPNAIVATVQFPEKIAVDAYNREQYAAGPNMQGNMLLSAMIAGILLFSGIIYWRFFRIVRVRFYLYYALFLFGFSLLYSPVSVLFQAYPLINLYISDAAFVTGLFFFTQFFRSYLRTRVNYKRWDKWLILVSWLPLLSFVLNYVLGNLLPEQISYYTLLWGNRSYILVLDSLLITAVLYIDTHKTSAGIIATIPALLLWGLGQTFKLVYASMASGSAAKIPWIIQWLNENNYLIDLICIVWIVSVFSSLLFQRFAHLQKQVVRQAVRNERLKRQKEIEQRELIAKQKAELEHQVEQRTLELKQSLENLKATQAQLIQVEKMASLGELTAGVAHEIQNPLNFINNFSELSIELLSEVKEEMKAGNTEDVLALVDDLTVNLTKVMKHGQRADAIVKAMLQHSRSTAGQKQSTDINALADEFMRLSYHGFKAVTKDFNATLNTEFDETLEPVEIVPQDVGRVLLNLFNNAFYAVNEKKKVLNGTFEPTVSVKTTKENNNVVIRIKDNGNGIPAKALEKIYQPFYTTKPTGEGTGLGLSLSYDIITKGHGGEMKVVSKEGEGAEFIICLPQSSSGRKV
jgi:signal transduction histidine kinase